MSDIDRDALLHQLSDLAAEDDAVVLAAARAANAMVTDGGLTWNDVLVPPPDADDFADGMDDDEIADLDDEDEDTAEEQDQPDGDQPDNDQPEDDQPVEDQPVGDPPVGDPPVFPVDAKISDTDAAEAKTIIDALLARKGLFEATRDELKDYKQDLADGDLHPADVSYLRALNKRLSKKK